MKVQVVLASINRLLNVVRFKDQFLNPEFELSISVIDEGNPKIRRSNIKLLHDFENLHFYGPKEREEWFKERFKSDYKKKLAVIPERCHAETSFGFLLALEQMPDMVIVIDDDVFPVKDQKLVELHQRNLVKYPGEAVDSKSLWYNTLEALEFKTDVPRLFPRGHPYQVDTRQERYLFSDTVERTVLNMGLWTGNLDYDAPTLLSFSALNGRADVTATGLKREKVVVKPGTYFALCGMNVAFRPRIIPAYYQLYMNYSGIDRFDDIWSGLFIKKIADTMGDPISLGAPLIYHDKRPRSIFKDLGSELHGIAINEILWGIVHNLEVEGKDYHDCCSSLINGVEKHIPEFKNKSYEDFMRVQVEKTRLWLDVIDEIS